MRYTYEGSIKEQNVWDHWPYNGCQVTDIQKSRPVPLDKEGYYRISKEVEADKADIVEDYLNRVPRRSILEGFVFPKNYKGLKCCQEETE